MNQKFECNIIHMDSEGYALADAASVTSTYYTV